MPLALNQGTFNALISSDEGCNSARLWEAGVKYSYVDHQFLAQYMPMVGKIAWEKLAPAQQKLMTSLWAENIESYNKGSATSQANARSILEKNGVKFFEPDARTLATTRTAMIDDLATLVEDAKLSPEIVKLVKEAV